MSEVWASKVLQHERELQMSLETERGTSLAKTEELDFACGELLQERQAYHDALAEGRTQTMAEIANLRTESSAEIKHARQQEKSLAMQLTEAMDTLNRRDLALAELQQSLSGEVSRARPPPEATPLPLQAPSPLSRGSRLARRPPALHLSTVAAAEHDIMARDDTTSVCRISTESTTFGSARPWLDPADRFSSLASRTAPCAVPSHRDASAESVPTTSLEDAAACMHSPSVQLDHGVPPSLARSQADRSALVNCEDMLSPYSCVHRKALTAPGVMSTSSPEKHETSSNLVASRIPSLHTVPSSVSVIADSSASGSRLSSGSTRSVFVREASGTTASTEASQLSGADAVEPWELPPKDFLALWRKSRGRATARGSSGLDAAASTLKITTCLE